MKIQIARGRTLPVRGAAGDIVLEAGESFRLGLPGLAVVEAFSDAAISTH